MTDLATIEASWDRAARENATFNILTHPEYRLTGWPVEEFFAHGRAEIDQALGRLDTLGVRYKPGRALDFGCGVGRLTQALAHYFTRVDGVDVSTEMVRLAEGQNTRKGVRFHVNGERLPFRTNTFHFAYSMIVLQHMPQDMQKHYVGETFRVLRPGGVAMFHTPEGPDAGHPGWHLSMFGAARETVEAWIAGSGGTLIDVEELGSDSNWRNLRYTATA